MKGKSKASKTRQGKDSTTLKATRKAIQLELHATLLNGGNPRTEVAPLFATVESLPQNNETILKDRSLICNPSTPTPSLLQTLAQESTSSAKDCKPYWTDFCAEISSQLSLPVVTDSHGLDLSLYSTWSSKTVDKSWFSTKLYTVPNQNYPAIYSQSFTSLVAECRTSESTPRKSRKIYLKLTPQQKAILKQWFGVSRFVYNTTIKLLQDGSVKANWKAIKGNILNGLPDWCKEVPYQIKSIAIKDACKAVSNAKKKYKDGGGISKCRFRSRKDSVQSCYIPKSAVKAEGIYHTILGKTSYKEALPSSFGDCRLVFAYGDYYLTVPEESPQLTTDNQGSQCVAQSSALRSQCVAEPVLKTGFPSQDKSVGVPPVEAPGVGFPPLWRLRRVAPVEATGVRVVALDPGIRTFLTFFSETSFGWLGDAANIRIQKLCFDLDKLISKISKAKSRQKKRLKTAATRLRGKIKNLVSELHKKTAHFLVTNFDVVLLPTFETSQMAKKAKRRIKSKSVRQMLTLSHYQFKQFLKHKAFEHSKVVLDVNEAYTSKTVSWTGEIVNNLGGSKTIKSPSTQQKMDTDLNGARGVFLRALVDTPWLVENLAW
jgi:putative transposase